MQWNQGLNARRTKQLLQVSRDTCAWRLQASLERPASMCARQWHARSKHAGHGQSCFPSIAAYQQKFDAPLCFSSATKKSLLKFHITWAAGVSIERVKGWTLPLPGGPPASCWHSCCPQQQCQHASHTRRRAASCPGVAATRSCNQRAGRQGSAGHHASRGTGSARRCRCPAACIRSGAPDSCTAQGGSSCGSRGAGHKLLPVLPSYRVIPGCCPVSLREKAHCRRQLPSRASREAG